MEDLKKSLISDLLILKDNLSEDLTDLTIQELFDLSIKYKILIKL